MQLTAQSPSLSPPSSSGSLHYPLDSPTPPSPDQYAHFRPDLKIEPPPYPAMHHFYTPSPSDAEFHSQDTYSSSPSSSTTYSSGLNSAVLASPSTSAGLSLLPDSDFAFPPQNTRSRTRAPSGSSVASNTASIRATIAHPYARLYTKKEGNTKRRRMWNHALEKSLFTPREIASMNAPHRRTIYTASLEAHVDQLHNQLLSCSLFPVPFQALEKFRGLNCKTAKSMVAGLHRDAVELKLKNLELQRANENIRTALLSMSLPQAVGKMSI